MCTLLIKRILSYCFSFQVIRHRFTPYTINECNSCASSMMNVLKFVVFHAGQIKVVQSVFTDVALPLQHDAHTSQRSHAIAYKHIASD